MTTYAVSGSHRELTQAEKDYVRRIVKKWVLHTPRTTKLVSGVALGVDTEAVLAVWGLLPMENITMVVPGTAWHNEDLVALGRKAGCTIVEVPDKKTDRDTYMTRNDVVVKLYDRALLAFPESRQPSRSGTWATIRRAFKADKPTRIYALENA